MIKLKDLLNENWKNQYQSMKVYDNPFHKAFAPTDGKNEQSTFDNESGNKMLTKKVIKKLKERKTRIEDHSKRAELQELIEKLEDDYQNGTYLDEIKTLYEVIKESFFKRQDMPQVKSGDLGKAIQKLQNMKIRVTRGTATAETFDPSQKDIYDDKVRAILKRTQQSNLRNMKPLVVSKDDYIVDGHHRWKALLVGFPGEKIPYIKIDLPIKRAIQMYNHVAELI